jgi:hypothetical protein
MSDCYEILTLLKTEPLESSGNILAQTNCQIESYDH